MLEIPESYVIAKQLNEIVKGKNIVDVVAAFSPHGFAFYYGEPEDYPLRLQGKVVGESRAVGGQIEMGIEDMILLLGDGANIRYHESDKILPKKHQLLLTFEDNTYLAVTVQMYGSLMAFKRGENNNYYYKVAVDKPSPLSEEFTEKYFASLYDGLKKTIRMKGFLATEQRIPGLGNGSLQDILFRAGLHPFLRVDPTSEEQRKLLYDSIRTVLTEMTEAGGRDTEKDLLGNKGGYQTIMSKTGYKEPCSVCGEKKQKGVYMGGNVYFCPICQKI